MGGGVGGSAERPAAGRGPRTPSAPGPPRPAGSRGPLTVSTPSAGDDLHGGKGCADAAGPRGRLGGSRRPAALSQVLSLGCASSQPRANSGQDWATVTSPPAHPTPDAPAPLLIPGSFFGELQCGERRGECLDEGGSLTPSVLRLSVVSSLLCYPRPGQGTWGSEPLSG